jgi:putative transcriptional regulator
MADQTLGQKIKNFRKRSGMSQLELESAISASPGSISRIESGKVNPTKETLFNISESLQLSPREAGSLFDINITEDLAKFIEIDSELSNKKSVKELIDFVTGELKNVFSVKYASVWIFNENSKTLKLESVCAPKLVMKLAENFMDSSFLGVTFDLKDPRFRKNYTAKAFLEEKTTITNNLYDISRPLISKKRMHCTE